MKTFPTKPAPVKGARACVPGAVAIAIAGTWGSHATLAAAGAALCALSALSALPIAAVAQAPAASADLRDFDIPAAPLGDALTRYAQQAGVQVRVPAALTAGKTAPAVKGRQSPDAALRQLLAGSGLIASYEGAGTVLLSAAPQGANVLGAVRVGGAAAGAAEGAAGSAAQWEAGPNGSSDATATEGQKSYAATAISLGDGSTKSIKDTPQTISVIGSKQIQEQNLVTLSDVLQQAPGITVQNDGFGESTFYSRGFQITKIQIDGGAPATLGGYTFQGASVRGDLAAMYDHVEVLRGAVGATDGFSDPSGSVNLERKRPLDHFQFLADGSYGSWVDRRVALDLTGPIAFDGKLRARAVVARSAQDYFYDTAKSGNTTFYGILEADVAPSTMLTFGASHNANDGTVDGAGLPVNSDGSLLNVSRSTSFIPSWSNMDISTNEIFAKLEHHFNENWSFKGGITRQNQSADAATALISAAGGVAPDGSGISAQPEEYSAGSEQVMSTALVKGKFSIQGLEQNVSFGYSRNLTNVPDAVYHIFPGVGGNWSLGQFDPDTSVPNPATTTSFNNLTTVLKETEQTAFVKLNALLTPRLHATAGFAWLQAVTNSTVTQNLYYAPSDTTMIVGPTTTYSNNVHRAPSIIGLSFDLLHDYAVYASVSDAYLANGSKYVYDGGTATVPTPANSKLATPTTGKNYEAGLKYLSPNKLLNASAALFYIKQNNVLESDERFDQSTLGFACCYIQPGRKTSKGLDLQVSGTLARGLQLTGGYTYDVTGYSDTNLDYTSFVFTPRHILTLWGSYQPDLELWNKFIFNAGVNYESKTYAYSSLSGGDDADGNALPDVDVTTKRPSYAVFGAGVGYHLSKQWSVDLKVKNLFDRVYYQQIGIPTGNYYGPPRSVKLSVHGAF